MNVGDQIIYCLILALVISMKLVKWVLENITRITRFIGRQYYQSGNYSEDKTHAELR
jgi:hypothetical protein